ncbi:hypothetical protein OH492_25220 [Vibrio chagasii]|nr:hypothetical protein [Vibrio chagasii]
MGDGDTLTETFTVTSADFHSMTSR